MIVKKAQADEMEHLQILFVETITAICEYDYNEKQIDAWTSSVKNKQRWQGILNNQLVMVLQKGEKIYKDASFLAFHVSRRPKHKLKNLNLPLL